MNQQTVIESSSPKRTNESSSPKRANEGLVRIFDELGGLMLRKGEPFKSRAYTRASEAIIVFDQDIVSADQLKGVSGIGAAVLKKAAEYIASDTGTIQLLETERSDPSNLLAAIHGIGPKRAAELVALGYKSVDELQRGVDAMVPATATTPASPAILNNVQMMGMKYRDDISQRIPRMEIVAFNSYMAGIVDTVADTSYEIVGSYRRGAADSGDIDIIFTGTAGAAGMKSVMDTLAANGTIVEFLSRGKTKSMCIAKLDATATIHRRVDFLYASPKEFPFAILYFTGSKAFNVVMRHEALKQGYSLNEHGLYTMIDKKKGAMVETEFSSETSIFEFLGMAMKSPEERTNGRAVVLTGTAVPVVETNETNDVTIDNPIDSIPLLPVPHNTPTTPEPVRAKLVVRPPKQPIADAIAPPKQPTAAPRAIPVKRLIADFKARGIAAVETLPEALVADMVRVANKAYYNAPEPMMTDDEFDIIKEYIEATYPTNNVLREIGAPIEKGKVKLPFNMPSMNKIKPTSDALDRWVVDFLGPYVITPKMDGVSGMYVVDSTGAAKLYTRGDGTYGQDVSHLIPYMKLPTSPAMCIRGEFEITNTGFEAKYAEKFSNPRNFVSGVINQTTRDAEKYTDIDFVVYEVIEPALSPSKQFDFLDTHSIMSVPHEIMTQISNDEISKRLIDTRENFKYATDGIIVANDATYERTPKNPTHSFAFKQVLGSQTAEAKVLAVEWSPSKDGLLKPRVRIEPIQLGGVVIEYATGFNAKFIRDKAIGVGALITLVRSGDVIPHIMGVVRPAAQPMMPTVDYIWNATGVDAMLADAMNDPTVIAKRVTGFFKGLDIDGVGPGNVKRIIAAGFTTVPQILKMSVEEFETVDGFKKKTADKIYANIVRGVAAAKLPVVMSATNIFGRGFGVRRITAIIKVYPDILTTTDNAIAKVAMVEMVEGIAHKTAGEFVAAIPEFMEFIDTAGLVGKLENPLGMKSVRSRSRSKSKSPNSLSRTLKRSPVVEDMNDRTNERTNEPAGPIEPAVPIDTNDPAEPPIQENDLLTGKRLVSTGFRDKPFLEMLELIGMKIGSSVSSKTDFVLVKTPEDIAGSSSKLVLARSLGVRIVDKARFEADFNL